MDIYFITYLFQNDLFNKVILISQNKVSYIKQQKQWFYTEQRRSGLYHFIIDSNK